MSDMDQREALYAVKKAAALQEEINAAGFGPLPNIVEQLATIVHGHTKHGMPPLSVIALVVFDDGSGNVRVSPSRESVGETGYEIFDFHGPADAVKKIADMYRQEVE